MQVVELSWCSRGRFEQRPSVCYEGPIFAMFAENKRVLAAYSSTVQSGQHEACVMHSSLCFQENHRGPIQLSLRENSVLLLAVLTGRPCHPHTPTSSRWHLDAAHRKTLSPPRHCPRAGLSPPRSASLRTPQPSTVLLGCAQSHNTPVGPTWPPHTYADAVRPRNAPFGSGTTLPAASSTRIGGHFHCVR